MLGMEMMLKSLGLDPAEMKKAVEGFGAVVVDIKTQLDRIEAKLDAALPATTPPAASENAPVKLIGSNDGPIETKTLQIVGE